MTCEMYRRHWLGEILRQEFADHLDGCAECREAVALDALIEDEARALPAPTAASGLWKRIAGDLGREKAAPHYPRERNWLDPRRHVGWKLAAVLAVAVGLSASLLLRPGSDQPGGRQLADGGQDGAAPTVVTQESPPARRSPNLLTEQALARVESLEAEYEQAIGELESLAGPVIAGIFADTDADAELILRYRDRLETIDSQIRRCRTVLARDGANAHVRRYLMTAYQDKKETLTRLLQQDEG